MDSYTLGRVSAIFFFLRLQRCRVGHKITITYSYSDMPELLPAMLVVFAPYATTENRGKQLFLMPAFTVLL